MIDQDDIAARVRWNQVFGALFGPPDEPVVLGRFVLERHIGAGAMGDLYAAYDPELDRRVAIKLVRPGSTDPHARERLLREAQVLARVSHPHVVPVYEIGDLEGQVFVAMELVEGVTLDEWRAGLDAPSASRQAQILDRFLAAGLGLQAAHDAGLVHRDFKPANVIVATDGRVRVVDFGLAQRQGVPAPERRSAGTPAADTRLTVTGSIVGTPRYMAPEQWGGAPCDAASDQFSFCVALYEALFDMLPFPADTIDGLRAAVLSGAPPQVPRGSAIPSPIRRALLRGLSLNPRDRFGSMGALLTALRRGRARRRRRMLVAAALVPAVIVGGIAFERYGALVREQSAQARLQIVDRRIDGLIAEGRIEDAERAFTAFVHMPENRGTQALVRAWLRHADRAETRGDETSAIQAYAQAYSLADTAAMQGPALLGAAHSFRRTRQWRRLGDTLDALERVSSSLATSPEAWRMRAEERLARLDLAGFSPPSGVVSPELLALTKAFSRASVVSSPRDREDLGVAMFPARGPLVLQRVGKQHVSLRDPYAAELPEVGRILFPGGPPDRMTVLGPDGPFSGLFVTQHAQHFALVALRTCPAEAACRAETLYAWHAEGASQVVAAMGDLDRDGRSEVYVGHAGYEKQLLGIRPGHDGRWGAFVPHSPTDATRSDISGLAVSDLDDDGRPELVVVTGGWTAYDVRVLRAAPGGEGGELVLAARKKLGTPSDVAIVPRADGAGAWIAVSIDHLAKNLRVFPPTEPFGPPAGVYTLDFSNERLAIAQHVPFSFHDGQGGLVTGDFDADGRTDLAREVAGEHATVLLLQDETGRFREAWLESVRPLFSLPRRDGAGSALAATLHDRGVVRFAVLGIGGVELAREGEAAEVVPLPEVEVDPAVRAAWRRAEELVAMGMHGAGAHTLLELAQIAVGDTEDALRVRAASLLETEGAQMQARLTDADRVANEPRWLQSWAQAAALYEGLGSADHPERFERAADLYSRMHQFSDALRVLSKLAATVEADGERARDIEARAGELRRRVEPLRSVRISFDEPLRHPWRVTAPGALRRGRSGLGIQIVTEEAPVVLADLPLVYRGGPVSLAMDIDAVRAEWGARLSVSLRSVDRPSSLPIELRFQAWGGGSSYQLLALCSGIGWSARYLPLPSASVEAEQARHHLAVTVEPDLSMQWCTGDSARGGWRRRFAPFRELELEPGAYSLQVTAMGSPYMVGSRADFVLRSLRVDGMEASDVEATAGPPAAVAAVEGRLEEALAGLDAKDPHDGWRRYPLLDELGAWSEADALLERLARAERGGPCGKTSAALTRQLRLRPDRVAPVLRRVCPPKDYFAVMWDAFAVVAHHHPSDPEVQRILVTQLGSLERHAPADRRDAEAAIELLIARAGAWRARGSLHAARTDLIHAIEIADRFDHPRSADAHRALAAILALLGGEDAALAELRRALADSRTPEIVADMVAIDPALRTLREGRARSMLHAALEGRPVPSGR